MRPPHSFNPHSEMHPMDDLSLPNGQSTGRTGPSLAQDASRQRVMSPTTPPHNPFGADLSHQSTFDEQRNEVFAEQTRPANGNEQAHTHTEFKDGVPDETHYTPGVRRQQNANLSVSDVASFIINKQVGTGIFTTPPLVALFAGSKGLAFTLWIIGFGYTLLRYVMAVQLLKQAFHYRQTDFNVTLVCSCTSNLRKEYHTLEERSIM